MVGRRAEEESGQVDLFSVAPDELALHRGDERDWPDATRFPHNRPGQRVRSVVRPDLVSSTQPTIVAGFTSIGELIDLVDEWSGADDGTHDDRMVRVLLGSEPFASSRRTFASAHARFTEDVRRYWLEERGISLDLSAAVVTAIEAIDAGRLEARAVVGDRPLHAKVFIGDHAATVGSSNFTGAGLVTNLEVNARFADDTDPVRFEELVRTGRALWEIGRDWTVELRSLLEALLRVVPWQDALAAACADLLEGEWARRYLDIEHTADGFSLWPSQQLGIAQALWIIENVGSVLVADATGSGKTRMGAHLVRAIRDRLWSTGRVRRDLTVLVCPPAVEEIWRAEAVATGLSIDTVSHGLLSRRSRHGTRIESDQVQRAQVLAVDEAHNFLNRDSNRTQQVRESRADHVALFTATPINRGAPDLLNLIGLLGADNFDDATLEILQRLERRRGGDELLNRDELAQVQREIQRFTVRRTKSMLNDLVDREPERYLHPDGSRTCRYPVHVARTYETGESTTDTETATHIRSIVDELVGISQMERHVVVPAALRREYTDERWLELRLSSSAGLARHHVLGAMRSSRAALVEHLSGTAAAIETFELPPSFKPQPTGNVIARLEELAGLGPPTVELTCELPGWLVDPAEWRQRCEEERSRYAAVLEAADTLSDRRERRKAALLVALTDDHPRVLAFDHHLITLFVLERLLEAQAQEVLVATGSASQVRKEVERRFARSSTGEAIALCSDAMNEGINLQGASTVVHLDLPTTLRVAEQRVGRVDRMDSPHDAIEVWWPDDGPAFATRANELLAQRAAESNALLGANVVLPQALRGDTVDLDSHIATVEERSADEWDGIRDALDPVRQLVTGSSPLVPNDVYERHRTGGERVRTHLSLVRSDEPFGFLAVAATAHGAPRWLLIRKGQALTDLAEICSSLTELLSGDPETVALDDAAFAWLRDVLASATRAERSLLPRRMQRALAQMRSACAAWADQCRRNGDERAATRWMVLSEAASGTAEQQPDSYALAEAWLSLVRPRLDAHRRQHRRARYVLLRDIDTDLVSTPLDVESVEHECSGLLQELPLGERVRACILGLPGAGGDVGRSTWGLSHST
ncbi:MAG TPA: helicase [Acidimicrobiaceae bacterium]|nr:helicase [Acidimicrobiaceae bacterium]